MSRRLTSGLTANALIRMAEAAGGFGAVIRKGDEQSGEIMVVLTARGEGRSLVEKRLQPDSRYVWTAADMDEEKAQQTLERRVRFDPDLWILELDVPSPERFAAEMNGLD